MVKHIVFFKIKENLDRSAASREIIETLKPLKDQIPQIRFYELGINFADRESAYDVALVSHFDNKAALDVYRNHPLHKEAVEKIKKYILQTAVVDYEIK